MLQINKLNASFEAKQIISNVDLEVNRDEIHLVMGPNGAGKSTLSKAIINWPSLTITGKVTLDDKDISDMPMYERARLGIFLGHQAPIEIPGVHYIEFVRQAYNLSKPQDQHLDPWAFKEIFEALADGLGLPSDIVERSLNEGFSGGERKKAEILQMLLLEPKIAILDEIDSGLDLDSLKVIFNQIKKHQEESQSAVMLISHNPNILKYITPTHVHLMVEGSIKESGDIKLAEQIIKNGYANS